MTKKNNSAHKPTYKEYMQAFLDYLGRPKTVFDLKDRAKAAAIIGAVIILVQMVVEKLIN
ncbi:MAG: hypothetical protein IJV92_06370 [Phascolarctobacterium sp.]|nr:hypothetical protein [Phascolarctobacterium sp.]